MGRAVGIRTLSSATRNMERLRAMKAANTLVEDLFCCFDGISTCVVPLNCEHELSVVVFVVAYRSRFW